MRTAARVLAVFALSLLGLALVTPSPAGASLGGVELHAQGFGWQWTFDQPGSPIPAKPTGEMEQAYTAADYASGPTVHALASVFWPGSAGANAGPVFGFPAYPVRAEAFAPANPHKSDNDYGPHTTMHAEASDKAAKAETTSQGSDEAGAAFFTGDFASSARTSVTGDLAVSEATATASDVDLGGGAIHIGSVVTEGKAVTDGKHGDVSGGTTVSGVTVGGQKVTVDQEGVHAGDQDVPVLDPINNGQVQQVLDQAGITMKVAKPVDVVKGPQAQRTLGGLVITFESDAFNVVLDQLPKEIRDQIETYVQFNQTITMDIGAVTVGSQTIGGLFGPPPGPPSTQPPAPGGGGGSGGGTSVSLGGGGIGGGGSVTVPSSGGTDGSGVASVPVSLPIDLPPGKAIPVALAVFGLLLAAGSSRILKVIADNALAARGANQCPLEQ